MSMFKPTSAKTVDEYIGLVDEPRRSEIKQLHELIKKAVPDLAPRLDYGMICYGSYHYKSASGREGEWSLICLASQKNYISLYVSCTTQGHYLAEEYKNSLPKANIGKSCIRIKRLADVDLAVITEVLQAAAKIGPMQLAS